MSCYNLKTSMKLHNYYLSEPFLFADCIHVLVVVVVAVAVVAVAGVAVAGVVVAGVVVAVAVVVVEVDIAVAVGSIGN